MKEQPQKIKLLSLLDFLKRETDEQHPISRKLLCQKLNEMGIPSNPRTLSLDIELLNKSGYEVMECQNGREKCYYIEDREFSIPELKILIDAVEAASFISPSKTDELIDKIAELGGAHKADILKKNMVCFNTRKHQNKQILFSVDCIEDAIYRKKKIAFHYYDLNESCEREYRLKESGEIKRYYVEPIALIFNEDNYYLMTYSSRHPDTTANYRVDRMEHVEVVEDSVLSDAAQARIEGVGNYTEQVFKMYNGETVSVVLEFEKCLIGPVFDKFGEETKMMHGAGNKYVSTVEVQISKTFFGWLAQFGSDMRIISPNSVIDQYRNHIAAILYGGNTDG